MSSLFLCYIGNWEECPMGSAKDVFPEWDERQSVCGVKTLFF